MAEYSFVVTLHELVSVIYNRLIGASVTIEMLVNPS
jgi:hypothetical protein